MSEILSINRRRILFVCTGNLCRSPMAEYLLKRSLRSDPVWEVESAGTHAVTGEPASGPAVEVLSEIGIDLSSHRSRHVTNEIVQSAELIVTMTKAHADEIKTRFPQAADRVFTLKSFDPGARESDVPDPIGSSSTVYRKIREEIEEALPKLIIYLNS